MASPVDVVAAFVRGARNRGARCLEGVTVTAVHHEDGRVTGVGTDAGDVKADYVVNCAGLWGRDDRADGEESTCPSIACEHYYAHTEKIPTSPPTSRPCATTTSRPTSGRTRGASSSGAFEPVARPIDVSELPADFCFDELPGHAEEQLMPVLEDAMHRLPVLGEVGWRSFFCGPESFTPDDQFHLGEAPGLRGTLRRAAASTPSASSPEAGSARHGRGVDGTGARPLDLAGNDIRRMVPVPEHPPLPAGVG